MGYKQVGDAIGATGDNLGNVDEVSAIADKTHLANLITSLKSELASANALLANKKRDCDEAKEHGRRAKGDLNEANKRVSAFEKQCENYRQTVSILGPFFN